MGLKDYYEKAKSLQALSNKSAADIGEEVESAAYHTEDIIREERFIPQVNFKYPKNFARYGSAEEYYAQSLRRIYEDYPYDGSLRERLEWENKSTYLDLHVFENEYPRTNGYINMSAGEWGNVSAKREGYGLPSDVEYIFLKGGPHPNPDGMSPYSTQLTGANYYETALNRTNNLQFDLLSKGATVEFWMKKDAFDLTKTEKEVIFDLWNGNASGSGNYGRFRLELTGASGADCLRATVLSGGHGFEMQSVADSTLTSEAIADGTWHHYALTMMSASNGVLTNFYLDGNLNRSQVLGSSMDLNEVTGALRANIGALISSPVSSSAAQYSGKLSASLDEFRYWKTERSGKEIGRHWFTQVGGGTNDDPEPFKTTLDKVNTDLGVYYKFNEGITGVAATDSVLLDYSGRISNGSWTGYSSASRATGSAIVLSNAAIKEFKDPIIYAFHPEVSALATRMRLTGSSYDVTNNAAIYNTIPAWITEEDNEGQRQLKHLVQIMSSYFDTLQLQVESLPSLGNINYASGSHKPLPFADRLVSSAGLAVPELFIDADIIEKLADRSEDRIYEKSLADIKNTIYQNIYNNLVYIYKTKGTEKSFRNLIRCFGIDDDLVKLNMYGNGIEYEVRENRRTVSVVDKFVDFNTSDNTAGTVYQSQGTDTTNTKGYLPTLSASATGFAQTLEADILFPLKADEDASFYYNTNTISASLFGMHAVHNNENYTTWATSPADSANFQVYAVRDEMTSDSVRFVLTGTAGTCVPWSMASDLYENVYDNTYWNLAVRIKPLNYPQAGQVLGAPTSADINNYTIELHGVQLDAGDVRNEFNIAATVEGAPGGFVTGSKRAFIGAHRTNFTGSMREYSDVKVNACRYWYDYLEDDVLVGHAYDTQNYGSLYPNRYAFPFNTSASFGEVLQSDTLVFNWEFAENTGSNASGGFSVADESSGSIDTAARFDALGDMLGYQYPAKGYGFLESSTKVVDKDHVISSKLQLPENVQSSDMITVLGAQEQQVFTRDSRPVNYFFAFEKSMAQALSVEMINYFATLKDIHNLIGAPVNRYRPEYKGLKVLRQRFFERVSNSEIDFEKFYEFYKWFDSSLTMMLQQLVPASADFAENVRTIIESHMLERSKYQHKIQNVKQQSADPEGTLLGNSTQMPQGGSPEDNPPGTGFFSANAATRRQLGTSQPINFKNWNFIHAPAPGLGESFSPTDKNSIWWQSEAARNTTALVEDTPSADPGLLKNKQTILENVKSTNKRAQQAPYKFGAEGNSTLGGVGFGINKKTDFVFVATTPFGSVRNGAAENIMVGFRRDVEELMNTKDIYHPAYKQRLGFGLNPDINRDDDDLNAGDGNLIAPFSIYSSSVATGQNLQVIQNYAPGIEITNLHHDIVHDSDTPLQGPFTEKFVGGRQYRHTELNEGSDSARYRAEGWKIKFDKVLSKNGADFETPMIGIVPPNYDGGAAEGFDKDVPTAHRLRNVGAKRPINIQNVKMTTSSVGTNLSGTLAHGKIGNYQKNYEVVQTSGRTQNDFYFNDQSFDFASNPETLATRGRAPMKQDLGNTGGTLDYELPNRTGANSNQSVIVNRFSAGGAGYEVDSLGYMDPAHEEMSVYNASPYRSPRTLNFGNTGSLGQVYGELSGTIQVRDQIGRPRGLRQLSRLHSGKFGADAVFGEVVPQTYVTVPSYHKTNRNTKVVMEEITGHAAKFDSPYESGVGYAVATVASGSMITNEGSLLFTNTFIKSTLVRCATPWAMASWLYIDANSPNMPPASDVSGTPSLGLHTVFAAHQTTRLYYDQDSAKLVWFYQGGSNNGIVETIGAAPLNRWFHVTLVRKEGLNTNQVDEKFLRMYINGEEDWQLNTDSGTGILADPAIPYGYGDIPTTIGARGGNHSAYPFTATGSQPWIGSMSEMVWYQNRTLATSAIRSLYNGGYTFNIFDKSMVKAVSEETIRQEYTELGLSSGSYSHYPTDLLTGLMAYYRFYQFSGSQMGGTDPSFGYSDNPARYDGANPWNTMGILNAHQEFLSGSYPTAPQAAYGTISSPLGNAPWSPILLNGNVKFESEVAPKYVQRTVKYDNLFVQHPIPRSTQQYSWVTSSMRHDEIYAPLNGDTVFTDVQPPSCIKATSLNGLALHGDNFSRGPTVNSAGPITFVTSSDRLVYYDRSPLHVGLNTMVHDPISIGDHILGSTQRETDVFKAVRIIPDAYEATPTITSRPGIVYGNPNMMTSFYGWDYEWDQLIGTGSDNANQMTLSWWMRKDGPGTNNSDISEAESLTSPPSWARIMSWGTSNMPSTARYLAGSMFTCVDGDGYLSFYASNWSTTSGSWIATTETGGPTIQNNKWYHVVMSYDGSSASNNPTFYINGDKYSVSGSAMGGTGGNVSCRVRPTGSYKGIVAAASQNVGKSLQIGHGTYNDGVSGDAVGAWNGIIADVAVWNNLCSTATNPGDIDASLIYNNGSPPNLKVKLPSDLVAWYRLSPGAGDSPRPKKQNLSVWNCAIPTAYAIANSGSGYLESSIARPNAGPTSNVSFPVSSSVFPIIATVPDLTQFSSDYATSFNTLNLGRNGPYGYPMWKQIRTGEHKVARQLRKNNKIGVLIPPAPAKSRRGQQPGKQANKFVDYTEMPVVYDTAKPIEFVFEDRAGGNKDNDLRLKVSYQNNMDYFSNQGLNNRLSLGERIRPDVGNAFNAAADYLFDSNLSAVVKYGQKIYPAAENTGQKRIRTREAYNFDDVWNEVRKYRSIQIPPKPNSQGFYDPGESIWPLDAPIALTHSPDSPAQQAYYPPGGLRGLVVQGGGIMPGGQTAFSLEPAGYLGSQAGELMNTYARFGLYSQKGVSSITASLAYIMPTRNGVLSTGSDDANTRPARGTGLLFGYQSWTAHESASMPYKPYEGYMENVQKLGKNMSIIPEFRISDHLELLVDKKSGDVLTDIPDMFSVTGAIQANSTNEDFYKVYSTSDFMKYFKVVDKQLANKTTSAGAQLKRYAIELSCDALMQFLPYKGFYPAERTVELGRLLSQSLGPIASYPYSDSNWKGAQKITKRILLEPLMAPGILFNTIKSGIACSSLVLVGGNGLGLTSSFDSSTTASLFNGNWSTSGNGGYRESNLDGTGYYRISSMDNNNEPVSGSGWTWPYDSLRIVSSGSKDLYGTSFYGQPIPFEAIRDPDIYLAGSAINRKGDEESVKRRARMFLYDTGLGSASLGQAADGSTPRILYKGNSRSPLYKLGIDNFLCETVNFFQQPLKSFISKPEEEFLAVKKDQYYGMRIKVARTNLSASESGLPLERTFGMYSRDSAFGPAVQLRGAAVGGNFVAAGRTNDRVSYEPWLPPHWYGSCEANVIFKAPYSGKVTLDEILGNKVTEFSKVSADAVAQGTTGIVAGNQQYQQYLFENYAPGYDVVRPQITSSVDIFEKLLVVPPGTDAQQARWLIQPKFETPMLNFFGVPASASALQGVGVDYNLLNTNSPFLKSIPGHMQRSRPKIRGMWHQYGKTLSGSEGVHLSIENMPTQYSSSTYAGIIDVEPLTKIVGIPTSTKRIGDFADEKTVEEAIVCVPFITVRGNREFFNVEMRSQEYVTQLALLNKYMFPPTMDFLKNHKGVKPFAFYAFEFSMQFTQKDLMDIWQNCAPTKASAFQKSNATIKIRSLVDKMLENKEELQWMVFKVKRKAEKDYSVYTKKGLTEGLPIVQPSLDSPYSYNWPYDYFSFVELVKIDESVTYATDDIIPEDEEEDVIMPDLREFIPAPKKLSPAIAPPVALLKEVEEGIPTKVIKPKTPPKKSAAKSDTKKEGSKNTTRSKPRREQSKAKSKRSTKNKDEFQKRSAKSRAKRYPGKGKKGK